MPENESYLDQDDDPKWAEWTVGPDGARQVLKRRPSGDCLFLGPNGCVLALEVRPLICRLHPYTYTIHGIDGVVADCHPDAIPPGRAAIDVLGIGLADARRWHAALYQELEAASRGLEAADRNRSGQEQGGARAPAQGAGSTGPTRACSL